MTDNSVLTDEVRADLKAKAEKATSSDWAVSRGHYGFMNCFRGSDGIEVGKTIAVEDAAFIAAANPAVILSLLAALEEAEGRIKAKDEALLSAALNLDACEVKIKHRARGGDLSHILVAGWADRARAAAAPSKREADKPEAPVNTYCPWCSEAIMPGQPTGTSDGELMHIGCAAEDMDNATFDRDMGGGR